MNGTVPTTTTAKQMVDETFHGHECENLKNNSENGRSGCENVKTWKRIPKIETSKEAKGKMNMKLAKIASGVIKNT